MKKHLLITLCSFVLGLYGFSANASIKQEVEDSKEQVKCIPLVEYGGITFEVLGDDQRKVSQNRWATHKKIIQTSPETYKVHGRLRLVKFVGDNKGDAPKLFLKSKEGKLMMIGLEDNTSIKTSDMYRVLFEFTLKDVQEHYIFSYSEPQNK